MRDQDLVFTLKLIDFAQGGIKMFDRREVYVQQERHKDFLLAAERHRLIQQIGSQRREKRDHVTFRALFWLGHHLIAWGCFLEKRYNPSIEAPAVPTANRCR